MTSATPPPPHPGPPPSSGPRVTAEQVRDLSRLRRPREGRMLAGVAEGLSRQLDIDPLLIRVVLGALTVFGGAGIVIYVLAWLTIPDEGAYDSAASRALHQDPERTMTVGLTLAGIAGAVTLLGAVGFATPRPFAVIVLSVVALVLFTVFSRRRGHQQTAPDGMPYVPYPPAGPATSVTDARAPGTSPAGSAATGTRPDTEDGTEEGADEGEGTVASDTTATTPIPTVTPEQRANEVRAWWQRPAGPGGPTPPGVGGPAYRPVPPPAPRPKSRLTPITLAVVVVALGSIWIADAAGADVHPSVYPGTVLALTAVALLIGTWFGRAKLLIPIGLISAFLTAAITVIGPGPYGERIYEPTSAGEVKAIYEHGAGHIALNLDDVADVGALDGRSIHVDSRVGLVQVMVPTSLDAQISSTVDGGQISGPAVVYDRDHGGEESVMEARHDGRPLVTIDIDLKFGHIEIFRVACPTLDVRRRGDIQQQDLSTMTWNGDDRDPAACN